MTKRVLILLPFVFALGCRGSGGGVEPAPAAEAALVSFLRAANDSNLTAMGEHWGTSRGPAARTNTPSDYQKRIAIMQVYLAGYRHRVLTNEAGRNSSQRVLQVELTRPGCLKVVPFTMVRAGNAWIVQAFDLEQVGNPQRACTSARP